MGAGVLLFVTLLAAQACTSHGKSAPGQATSYHQKFIDSFPCPVASAPGLPAGSGCVSSVMANLEGKGPVDRFVVYARLDSHRKPASWWAKVLLQTGSLAPTPLPSEALTLGTKDIYARVVGAADANGDGTDEVFVTFTGDLYHIASQLNDGIYAFRDGHLETVQEGGQLFTFRTDGTSRFGQGAECRTEGGKPVFTILRVQQYPESWIWTEKDYTWNGLTLVPGGSRSGKIPLDVPLNDPRVWHFYELTCGKLVAY